VRHLEPGAAKAAAVERERFDERRFRFELNEDQMASDKLAEGIRSFVGDIRSLERLVAAAA
jgi:transaldolase